MTEAENVARAREDEPSLLRLALRVVLGEITEAQALEVLRSHPAAGSQERQEAER